jgi:hypothetical protein
MTSDPVVTILIEAAARGRELRLARERARIVRSGQQTPVAVDLGGLAATGAGNDSTVKPNRNKDDSA